MANKATRHAVYEVLDSERSYQEHRWGDEHRRNPHSVTEFLVYMRDYVEEALHFLSREADPEASERALHWVRKVAALGVSCMEQHGAPFREGFEPKRPQHQCSAPEWCGCNKMADDDRTAVERARTKAYLSSSNQNYGVSGDDRLFCSNGCLDEARDGSTRP